jgi:hypothetical protein
MVICPGKLHIESQTSSVLGVSSFFKRKGTFFIINKMAEIRSAGYWD